MPIAGKLVIAVLVAAVATFIAQALGSEGGSVTALGGLFLLSNSAVALLTHKPLPVQPASPDPHSHERGAQKPAGSRGNGQQRRKPTPSRRAPGGKRNEGTVKWFNSAKGFGFVTMDGGEEIFVHFRSIRGEGRRSLEDGQRVSFTVASTEKGPQAEDVEPLGTP